jgi:hypothetical protein
MVEVPDLACGDEVPHGPQGEDGVEVRALVGAVVGVGPGKVPRVGGDLTVRAVSCGIVYVEARLFRQMNATGCDERDAALGERLRRADEGGH